MIGTPFNDLMLTEIFKSENPKQLYIMVKSKHDEIRLNYYDFASHIREEIRGIILEDFSNYCW